MESQQVLSDLISVVGLLLFCCDGWVYIVTCLVLKQQTVLLFHHIRSYVCPSVFLFLSQLITSELAVEFLSLNSV